MLSTNLSTLFLNQFPIHFAEATLSIALKKKLKFTQDDGKLMKEYLLCFASHSHFSGWSTESMVEPLIQELCWGVQAEEIFGRYMMQKTGTAQVQAKELQVVFYPT